MHLVAWLWGRCLTPLMYIPSTGLRALLLPVCEGVQLAEQSRHLGRGLRLQRHLQLYHPAAGPLPAQVVPQPNHPAAGAATRPALPRRHQLLPARLLDARLYRFVSTAWARLVCEPSKYI